jgi:hypothetical protein
LSGYAPAHSMWHSSEQACPRCLAGQGVHVGGPLTVAGMASRRKAKGTVLVGRSLVVSRRQHKGMQKGRAYSTQPPARQEATRTLQATARPVRIPTRWQSQVRPPPQVRNAATIHHHPPKHVSDPHSFITHKGPHSKFQD